MTAAAQVSPNESRFNGSYTANPVMLHILPQRERSFWSNVNTCSGSM